MNLKEKTHLGYKVILFHKNNQQNLFYANIGFYIITKMNTLKFNIYKKSSFADQEDKIQTFILLSFVPYTEYLTNTG